MTQIADLVVKTGGFYDRGRGNDTLSLLFSTLLSFRPRIGVRGDITFPCHSVLDTESGLWIPPTCHSVLDTESGIWIPACAGMTEEAGMTQTAGLVVKIPLEFYDTNRRFGRKNSLRIL